MVRGGGGKGTAAWKLFASVGFSIPHIFYLFALIVEKVSFPPLSSYSEGVPLPILQIVLTYETVENEQEPDKTIHKNQNVILVS